MAVTTKLKKKTASKAKPRKKKRKKGDPPWVFYTGILLVPVACFLFLIALNLLDVSLYCGEIEFFLWGMFAYIPIHLILWRPYFLHVTAHEFSHAIFTKLFLGSVYSLHIDTEDTGSITMSKKNMLISLAPYFFPLYSAVFLIIYLLSVEEFKTPLAVVTGFFLSCHYIMTLRDLGLKQPDIVQSGGKLFAFPVIAVLNFSIFIFFLFVFSEFQLSSGDIIYAAENISRLIK